MNVTISVEPGPHVSLVFAGDPLPEGNRDALVPIRAERSVDQDLLEDASLRIENALREQGYRTARASYTREEKGGELVLTFTIARGPLHRIESVADRGQRARSRPPIWRRCCRSRPATRSSKRAPGSLPRRSPSSIASAASRRRRSSPTSRCCRKRRAASVPYRPVAIRFEIVEGPQTIVSGVDVRGQHDDRLAGAAGADGAAGRQAVLPAAAVRRSRRHRARLPEPGLPERLGHLAADLRQRSAAGRAGLDDSRRRSDQDRSRADHRQLAHLDRRSFAAS